MKILGLLLWIAGFIIAKGFWSTLFCLFPLYSYYIVVEKALQHFGMI